MKSSRSSGGVGTDVGKFATAEHFASWLGICPDNRITGGRTPFEPARIGNPEQCRARKERFLRRQAEHLGFTMTPVEQEIS